MTYQLRRFRTVRLEGLDRKQLRVLVPDAKVSGQEVGRNDIERVPIELQIDEVLDVVGAPLCAIDVLLHPSIADFSKRLGKGWLVEHVCPYGRVSPGLVPCRNGILAATSAARSTAVLTSTAAHPLQ